MSVLLLAVVMLELLSYPSPRLLDREVGPFQRNQNSAGDEDYCLTSIDCAMNGECIRTDMNDSQSPGRCKCINCSRDQRSITLTQFCDQANATQDGKDELVKYST